MSDCIDLTRNSILLEDIETESKRFPGIRETELQIIAGPKGESLEPVMTSFKDPDGKLHSGFVFPVIEGMTLVIVQPFNEKITIMVKQVQKIRGPMPDGNAWAATLKPLHITDDISTIGDDFKQAVDAAIKKVKKPNPFNSYPTYAAKIHNPEFSIVGTTLECKRCQHTWLPRRNNLPKVCPKCKSPYWNKERQR